MADARRILSKHSELLRPTENGHLTKDVKIANHYRDYRIDDIISSISFVVDFLSLFRQHEGGH